METPDVVRNAAKRFSDRLCVVEGSRSHTFAQTDQRADRLAAAMLKGGLRRGDRVALLATNELEYLEIQVAAMRAGVILVPLNYRLALPELRFIVADCAPQLLIHGPGYAGAAAELGVATTWHLGADGHGEPYEDALSIANVSPQVPFLRARDASSILYTSGTTGRPKGAIISNAALHARITMFALEIQIRPGDVFAQALPMFHIASNVSYAFAYMAATNIMVGEFDPAKVLALLERHRATHVLLVPTMINLMNSEPTIDSTRFPELRLVLYGASPIPPQVLRRAIDVFGSGFIQFFGMTETAGCSLLRPADHDPDRHPERLASAGTDSVSFETRIVDADDRDVPSGQVGEIICRGPSLMDGYWDSVKATTAALRNGWMHTGDLGYRSDDGYLFVTDRLKDMIISGGENIYPREVEDVLYQHPVVFEAAVIGVPDARWGEAVHALIVPRGGETVDSGAILSHCRARLAAYKVPKSIEQVDELPKNATGKVLKRLLREKHADAARDRSE